MSLRSLIVVALLSTPALAATVDEELAAVFRDNLVAGRAYKKGFPGAKTRKGLMNEFLGRTASGSIDPDQDKHPKLLDAIDRAVAVRLNPQANPTQRTLAQQIAFEAAEAMTDGALMAGNKDLLDGLRPAFPSGGVRPGTDRPLPYDLPLAANGKEYSGANLINFGYARLHFLRGLKGTLGFLATDPAGNLRATDSVFDGEAFKQFTAFNAPEHLPLPRFRDSNFDTNTAATTAAYNYGNLLQRFGMANRAMAERLWRAAYADRKRTNNVTGERVEMLAKAAGELRRNIHAQFLSALPLAATLDEEEYVVARLDQAKVSAATSQELLNRIVSGEAPKLDSLLITANTDSINTQIARVASNYTDLDSARKAAKAAIDKWESATTLIVNDARNVRGQFVRQLETLSGVSPMSYGNLQTASQRRDYRQRIDNLLTDRLTRNLQDSSLIDGSELGKAAIQILRAKNDLTVGQTEILAIPQTIRVIEQEAGALNEIIFKSGDKMAAFDAASAVLEGIPKISITTGITASIITEFNFTAAAKGAIQVARTLDLASREARMNDVRTAAEVQKLLIRQAILVQGQDSLIAQLKLAIANYNQLGHQMNQLIEEAGTFQDESASLWYRDSKLLFQQEEAELRFAERLKEFVNSLYILSKMLETAWGEPFQNPYFSNITLPNGTHFGALGEGSTLYDPYTQPESFFNIVDVQSAKDGCGALHLWAEALQKPNIRGNRTPGEITSAIPISVRQDLLGHSDLEWNGGWICRSVAVLQPLFAGYRQIRGGSTGAN